ncbi:uncharacterized protein LOC132864385 [Neoarius graeffei]|uniref:uncharacterized protein LOC132864385 n=1 Tax=Neoarius graeffei TaxID=443677 RepID=UPI00298BFC8D|nr:uncharacterized protein LOC132864385 [Neoarius graeffei]
MGTSYNTWTTRLYFKVGNYRHKLGAAGCSEVCVNQKRTGEDSRNRLKKAKRCEVNFLPYIPTGQTDLTLQNEKAALQEEMKKRHPNHALINSKMEQTFALRRKEIVDEEPPVVDIMKLWPALFLEEQVHTEFYRITGVNLKETFFSLLDEYTPKIIKLYRSRSGAFGEDLKSLLDKMDSKTNNVILHRKTAALRGLPLFLRESTDSFFKSCLDTDVDVDSVNTCGVQIGILTVVEDDIATSDTDANVRCFALIIEEQIVLDDLPDLPTAIALLFGLIYALNMKYPKELKYMFETIQKVFMHLDTKLPARAQSFRNKMLRC